MDCKHIALLFINSEATPHALNREKVLHECTQRDQRATMTARWTAKATRTLRERCSYS